MNQSTATSTTQSSGRFVYFILSHTNVPQVLRLATTIRRLSPTSVIAIHHDLAGEPLDFAPFRMIGEVHMAPERLRVEWGHFSIVDAFIRTTDWLLRNYEFDWVITLSGQDYPLSPLASFETELRSSSFDAYFEHFDVHDPSHWPKGTGFQRYYFRYRRLPRNPYYYKVPGWFRQVLTSARRTINARQNLIRIIPRMRNSPSKLGLRSLLTPFDDAFRCWGGQNHLNLSRKCIVSLQNFVKHQPRVVEYYRRTYLPEESFVQTVLMNERFRVSPDLLRYVHWGKTKHPASPGLIRVEDVADALASQKPFGRKFDSRIDGSALDEVDRVLGL